MSYDEKELSQLRRRVRQKRKALKMTQDEAAREVNVSPRSFSAFETGTQPVSDQIVQSIARFVRDSREKASFTTSKKYCRFDGPEGPQVRETLRALTPETLEIAAEIIKRTETDVVCEISNEIRVLDSPVIKEHAQQFDKALATLTAKPQKEELPVESGVGFMPILTQQESRQDAARKFAQTVPEELSKQLYGAFVTARVQNGEATVFYLVLGAKAGEHWELEFTAPADPETLKRMRAFNEQKLEVN